jgi:predicted nucleic acid-binding protein
MTIPTRAVFDCNTFLQALASPDGPAGKCVQLALDGKVDLYLSPTVLEELAEVASRATVIAKLQLTPDRTQAFLEMIEVTATVLDGFSESFVYEREAQGEAAAAQLPELLERKHG